MGTMGTLFRFAQLILLLPALLPASTAYIPAVAINDTAGLHLSEGSRITVRWGFPAGEYSFGV